jgi:hypothetical protein
MRTLGKRDTNRKPAAPRTVCVGIRLSKQDAAKLRNEAFDAGRTLAGHVVYLLRKAGAF